MTAPKFHLIRPTSRLDTKPQALRVAFLDGFADGAAGQGWRCLYDSGKATPSATQNYERGRFAGICAPDQPPLAALAVAIKTRAIP